MKAQIVVDLGFGDSGKGITTDFLCSKSTNPIVVRYSGGQQAGHTVMIGTKKHVFSNFGSGTLRGVPSYFTEHCTIFIPTMYEEYKVLKQLGANPKLYIHPLAKVTTPYDVAYNRIREKKVKHGSCGLGIAATMKRHEESGYKLFAYDLSHQNMLIQKLDKIKRYYIEKCEKEGLDLTEFHKECRDNEYVMYNILIHETPIYELQDYSILETFEDVVFEGSQGILLDMDHGIFPNVTYANLTCKNALNVLYKVSGVLDTQLFYVTRCYQTRHGAGWMSNQGPIKLINDEHEINVTNEYQGNFRRGEIDYSLLNYSLGVDELYGAKRFPRNLVVTCLDQRPDFKFEVEKLDPHFERVWGSYSPDSSNIKLL